MTPPKASNSKVNINPVGNMAISELDKMLQNSLGNLLDIKLKDVATKSDIEGISAEISILKQSNAELKTQLNKMESRCVLLEKQVELLEKKSNEKNVVVHLHPTNSQNAVEKAKEICLDLLQTNNSDKITTAKQIGRSATNVIVEMANREDVFRILRAKNKLQNTGTTIHKDYPAAARERRKRLNNLRRNITSNNRGIKCQIKGETLLIDENKFFFDKSGKIISDAEDGLFTLKQLVGDTFDLTTLEDWNNEKSTEDNTRASQTSSGVHTRHV